MTKELNYSKGEWIIFKDCEDATGKPNGWEQIAGDGGRTNVALVPHYYDNFKANAQLIASAPDLYEACKGLQEVFKLTRANSQWRSCYADQKVRAMEQALAKAEGIK